MRPLILYILIALALIGAGGFFYCRYKREKGDETAATTGPLSTIMPVENLNVMDTLGIPVPDKHAGESLGIPAPPRSGNNWETGPMLPMPIVTGPIVTAPSGGSSPTQTTGSGSSSTSAGSGSTTS